MADQSTVETTPEDDGWVFSLQRQGDDFPWAWRIPRDQAPALHTALGEALGYGPAEAQETLAAAYETANLYREQRDEARAEAVANGARAQGYAATLHATQDTLALVRDWHADTRRRLEAAENPPQRVMDLETFRTMSGDRMWTVPTEPPPYSPGLVNLSTRDVHDARDVIKAVMDQVGPTRLRRLVASVCADIPEPDPEPSSTPVDQPVDDYQVGDVVQSADGQEWTKMTGQGWWAPSDRDVTAYHRLAWIREGFGDTTDGSTPAPSALTEEDTYPVGTRLEDRHDDTWTRVEPDEGDPTKVWRFEDTGMVLDLPYITETYGPLKPAHSEASDTTEGDA